MELIIPNWPAPSHIKAVSSTRIGGCSKPPYDGLNLGMHVGDDAKLVELNRQRLAKKAQMPNHPIWLNQTHSNEVKAADNPTKQVIDCDGLFTSTRGVVCSAMTADCVPVLMTNTEGSQVAAVHAGWRGLANGIVENAAKMFTGEVMAWVGPSIGRTAFEVGQDVVDAFTSVDVTAIEAFTPKIESGKYLADMNALVAKRLKSVGVELIYSSELCTYQDPARFYSYRRDGVTGRQASFIWIES